MKKYIFTLSFFISACSTTPRTSADLSNTPFDRLPSETRQLIEEREYDASELKILGTNFVILTRKTNGLSKDRIALAIKKAWPVWTKKFQFPFPVITFIDMNEFLGGGVLNNSPALGVYLGHQSSERIKKVIQSSVGWAPQKTATAYVELNYKDFADPMQAYVDDMVTHELGHLIFKLGRKLSDNQLDEWFALGLGLVYDRIVWSELYRQNSPQFGSMVFMWRSHFSKNSKIDQKLINPDIRNDAAFNLYRYQTYCHAKAWMFLKELRTRLGEAQFDLAVKRYLEEENANLAYDDFIKFIPNERIKIVNQVEVEFVVR